MTILAIHLVHALDAWLHLLLAAAHAAHFHGEPLGPGTPVITGS
jgi:hypothetical protein